MANLKGFIKNSNGDIILPISRGELIFDANGNIALHSHVFKAKAESGVKYTQEEIDAAREGDDAYGKSIKIYKTGTGKYGLMAPEDLLNLYEALARIDRIEQVTGADGGGTGGSLAQKLQDLIDKVGYQQGEVIGKNDDGTDNTATSDSGIYDYINKQIIEHLAQSDALKFKGTLGEGGNIEELPIDGINNGDTYKVITSGTYAGKTAKLGDLFIALYTPSDGVNPAKYTWELVPSGNEQETFIQVPYQSETGLINKVLSGIIAFEGVNGLSVQYVETEEGKGKVVISGQGSSISIDLQSVKDRVSNLELTVDGKEAYTDDLGVQHPAIPGLKQKVSQLQTKISDSVTTLEQAVKTEVGENGQPVLVNGDKLVKASALYDLAIRLSQHIANAETQYLQVAAMELSAELTPEQREYLKGDISN